MQTSTNKLLGLLFLATFTLGLSANAHAQSAAPSRPSLLSRIAHPVRSIRARVRKERALQKLQLKVRAMPRVGVKFHQRFGKLGGKEQFGTKGEWFGLLTGTAINVGGVIDPERAVPYFVASTVVGLGTVVGHVFKNRLLRRKTTISMVEDKTISDSVLKPFRKDLGLNSRNRKLTRGKEADEGAAEAPAASPTNTTNTITPASSGSAGNGNGASGD